MGWRIGCSGYHYKEWKKIFYPEKLAPRRWLEYYNEHFNTLELNVTFYRFPSLELLQGWYNRSPADYKFAVKVPRLITHSKEIFESQPALSKFYSNLRDGLNEKLGCVLFQLPPWFSYSAERLKNLISLADPSFRNVIEFRHTSWWREDVIQMFSDKHISFCSISHPTLPDEVIKTADLVYYRFHGVPKLYASRYKKQLLQHVVDQIIALDDVQEVYIYFNNTAEGYAIVNAQELQEMVGLMD